MQMTDEPKAGIEFRAWARASGVSLREVSAVANAPDHIELVEHGGVDLRLVKGPRERDGSLLLAWEGLGRVGERLLHGVLRVSPRMAVETDVTPLRLLQRLAQLYGFVIELSGPGGVVFRGTFAMGVDIPTVPPDFPWTVTVLNHERRPQIGSVFERTDSLPAPHRSVAMAFILDRERYREALTGVTV